jgi:hypothetical protein
MTSPDDIIAACRQLRAVAANANDCNLFVIALAARFEVTLRGNADAIMATITGAGWTQHGTDGKAAGEAAATGALVIGGMTSEALGGAHGHVVVVVNGPLNRDKYPTAFWGSLNPTIRPAGALPTTINFSFTEADRDKVIYASQVV